MRFKRYPQYKDSGVEWLGEIPQHWEISRVRQIVKSHKQGYYTEQDYVEEGIKLARITDIDDFANVSFVNMPFVNIPEKDEMAFRLSQGDFLFARSGTIGRFGIVGDPERSVFASYLIRFQFKDVDLEFLKYFFSSHIFKESLISTLHGGANQNVHAENIKEQIIVIPPDLEQLSIVSYLGWKTAKIDALIEKNERLIELLQEKRTALITHAVTKGLDPNVSMKDSGIEWLGEIPVHWDVKRLKNICHINPEILRETTDSDFEIQYIDISNVQNVTGILQPQEMLFEEAPSRARRVVRTGDTIISTVRTYLKAVAFLEDVPDNLIVSTGFAVLRPHPGIQPKYLYALVRCQQFIESVVANSVGVAYPGINPSELSALPVWLPPASGEQQAIINFLDRETTKIDNLCVKIREGIDRLKEYRTALISAAVTGKIDVREEVA